MEKSAEELAQEKTANNLLNYIIAKTHTRHTSLTEDEFLKEIGFDGSDKTESEAIKIAEFNLFVEITNQLLQCKTTLRNLTEYLRDILLGGNENE